MLLQVSRWDRLKDMAGVMRGFADYVAPSGDGYLMLVGPAVKNVSDDPEGATERRPASCSAIRTRQRGSGKPRMPTSASSTSATCTCCTSPNCSAQVNTAVFAQRLWRHGSAEGLGSSILP